MIFKRVANGWYAAQPSAETIAEAKREAAKNPGPSLSGYRAETVWVGFMAEAGFCVYLSERTVEYVYDGGYNGKPDFVFTVRGKDVDLKTVTVQKGHFYPHYKVSTFAAQRPRAKSEFYFAAYESGYNRLLFLGGMPSAEFYERATLIGPGEPLGSGHIAERDNYLLTASELELPGKWLARMMLGET